MAVQAQYPSNVLFLDRTDQERNNAVGGDYSQVQTDVFNNGSGYRVSNSRKRNRESVISSSVNLLCPTSTFANPADLHNQSSNPVSTGLRLAFQEQQQRAIFLQSPIVSSLLSDQMKQQQEEIDQFLQTQIDRLRSSLSEARQKHYRSLLRLAEDSASRILKEKEAEVAKTTRRNAELEARMARLRAETQAWQANARAQELMAASLQSQLQQAMMVAAAEPANDESGSGAVEDAESAYIDPERVVSIPSCRACLKRPISVVVLPCRHLSLCTQCESAITSCPICHAQICNYVEVFLS